MTNSAEPRLILVTGATGYIGGRLVPELLEAGYRVRVLARRPEQLRDRPWASQVELAAGDANDEAALGSALAEVDVAYYLLHSLVEGSGFDTIEEQMADGFGRQARKAGVQRIVYLGGLAPGGEKLSPTCVPGSG